ncbi:hypothetical protein [Nonomuraea sp. NPDC049480]|uniref:hypothetical protein n=1 Tax=Nonomuraea sp. NPDC049480 TaxID=3364353 RepID=UPI0037B351BA
MTTSRLGATALIAAVVLATVPGNAAAATPPVTPDCAWGVKVSADTRNIYYPDSAAAYWVLPFTVQEGLRIKLSGRYPDSRYASIQVYKEGGGLFESNGVACRSPASRSSATASRSPYRPATARRPRRAAPYGPLPATPRYRRWSRARPRSPVPPSTAAPPAASRTPTPPSCTRT